MLTREQIEAIRAAMVAPIIWAIIVLLLLAALIPLGKKCKDKLRSMAAACREGGLKKFCQYLFIGWGISVAMHVSAVKPNDPSSHPAPQRAPIHRVVEEGLPEEESDAEPQPLPPLRITGVERTDEAVSGTLAWDGTNDIQGATTIDVFVAHPALTNEFRWVKSIEVSGSVANCPWSVFTNELGLAEMPVALFVKMTERTSSASTMADQDGDLLPNVYELKHGTNPYVPDFDRVSKAVLGPNATQRSLQSALDASAPYDIISLPEDGTRIASGVRMPRHPVMIVGPTNGYARIETLASPYAFVLEHGQGSHMLFQNLYLNMLPDDDLQVGFWCGSDLPIGVANGTPGASGTFRNVYVRALASGYGMGWLFRKWNETPVELDHCVINAAGSRSFKGVSLVNAPETVVRNCTFLNFPIENGRDYGAAIQDEVIGEAVHDHRLWVERTVFDDSFTNAYAIARLGTGSEVTFDNVVLPAELSGAHAPDVASNVMVASNCVAWSGHLIPGRPAAEQGIGALAAIGEGATSDMDGDGLSDFDEIYVYGTNPFDRDSDGDGVTDDIELRAGTDPRDRMSHETLLHVSLTNIISSASLTNYFCISNIQEGWGNDYEHCWVGADDLNVTLNTANGLFVKAFTDVDANGVFDAASDVLLVKALPEWNSIISVELKMGDLDGDLVNDVQERADGTDPYSARSLRIRRVLKVSHSDRTSAINDYYQISATTNWSAAGWRTITNAPFYPSVDISVEDGQCYLHTYRDFNANGVYDEGVDGYLRFAVSNGSTTLEVTIGDSDRDGVRDSLEISEGTNPLDKNNFKVVADVYFENIDVESGFTNYVQTTMNSAAFQSDSWQVYPDSSISAIHTEGIVTNGSFCAVYYRDVNCNGVYDEDVDIFKATSFGGSKSHDLCGVLIGDCDGDGVEDSAEVVDGTNPMDRNSLSVVLYATISGLHISSTSLVGAVMLGGREVTAPELLTERTWHMMTTNLYAKAGESLSVRVWEDRNRNNRLDAGERKTELAVPIKEHRTCINIRMPLGDFDIDGDGMHDDWEVAHGLSPSNVEDALQDDDHDGLINLHEYYANCDPAAEDGSETALYDFSWSVDRRIADQSKGVVTFGSSWSRSSNCWTYGVDTSSASPYNSSFGTWKAGTAISRRHIVYATHYRIAVGTSIRFVSINGVRCERRLVAERYLVGTDLTVGLLESELPEDVLPAVVLPSDYQEYIGDALRLPMLMYNHQEDAIVTDSNRLPKNWKSADGLAPVSPNRRRLFIEVVSGDSGDPKFFISGTRSILVCTLTSYGSGSSGVGPFITYYKDRLQRVMDALCPGYVLEEFSFSPFRRLGDDE